MSLQHQLMWVSRGAAAWTGGLCHVRLHPPSAQFYADLQTKTLKFRWVRLNRDRQGVYLDDLHLMTFMHIKEKRIVDDNAVMK